MEKLKYINLVYLPVFTEKCDCSHATKLADERTEVDQSEKERHAYLASLRKGRSELRNFADMHYQQAPKRQNKVSWIFLGHFVDLAHVCKLIKTLSEADGRNIRGVSIT